MTNEKIAFGGGCHWCTEAIFQSLKGVNKVEQGFVRSINENSTLSEAVIVHFDCRKISLQTLVEVHLLTHKSMSEHSMRKKYRSAVYFFNEKQKEELIEIIRNLQKQFEAKIITKVLEFRSFKPSVPKFLNYYFNNVEKPFCETYINPKLKFIREQFSGHIRTDKLKHLYHEEHETNHTKF